MYVEDRLRKMYARGKEETGRGMPYYDSLILETTNYLPEHVLGMTDTKSRIWIRPRERMPYGLWDHVLRHELEHCLDPHASEETVDARAYDMSREPLRSRINLN